MYVCQRSNYTLTQPFSLEIQSDGGSYFKNCGAIFVRCGCASSLYFPKVAASPDPRITRRASSTQASAEAAMSLQGAKHGLCINKWKNSSRKCCIHTGLAMFPSLRDG